MMWLSLLLVIKVMNLTLFKVSTWMEENDLHLSIQKTVAVILTNKRGYEELSFILNSVTIKLSKYIMYLWV